MPTYEYICKDCGEKFDNFQSMNSPPLEEHPNCDEGGVNVERVISGGSGLIFKGSGFYLTDYKNKGKNDSTDKKEKKSQKENIPPTKSNNKKAGEKTE